MASVFKNNIYHIRLLSLSLYLNPFLLSDLSWSLSLSLVHIVSVFISFDTKYQNTSHTNFPCCIENFPLISHTVRRVKRERLQMDNNNNNMKTKEEQKRKQKFFVCRWMALSICNHHRHHYYHQHRFLTGNAVHRAETWLGKKMSKWFS